MNQPTCKSLIFLTHTDSKGLLAAGTSQALAAATNHLPAAAKERCYLLMTFDYRIWANDLP